MRNRGCDSIKGIIVIISVLLIGLVYAYTPEQQTTLDGMNLSYQLGIAFEKASNGQNVTEFNAFVETYNAWIREHFGEDANLFMSKINETAPLAIIPKTNDTASLAVTSEVNKTAPFAVTFETNETTPFEVSRGYKEPLLKPDSDLARFGKQQIRADSW